jgi:hypothetical protein
MIEELWLSFHARGERYKPSSLAYAFTRQNDPGDIGTRGRYKGQPTPFGYSEIEVPALIPLEEKVPHLCREVAPVLAAIRAAGAVDLYVSAGYFWKDQCNFQLTESDLAMLSALGCPISISCYGDDKESRA